MWDICLERIQKHLDFEYVQIWPILHTSEGLVWPLFGNIKCLLHFLGIIFWFLERYMSLDMLCYQESAQKAVRFWILYSFDLFCWILMARLAIFCKWNMCNDTFWGVMLLIFIFLEIFLPMTCCIIKKWPKIFHF